MISVLQYFGVQFCSICCLGGSAKVLFLCGVGVALSFWYSYFSALGLSVLLLILHIYILQCFGLCTFVNVCFNFDVILYFHFYLHLFTGFYCLLSYLQVFTGVYVQVCENGIWCFNHFMKRVKTLFSN